MAARALARLRELRDGSAASSLEVVDLAQSCWELIHTLGDERWVTLEQVFVACLDVPSAASLGQSCIDALRKAFPESTRVRRLDAMKVEAEGRFKDALAAYDAILGAHPTDAATLKRKVATSMTMGKPDEAIVALNNYLKIFTRDYEAWQQLADLYLSQLDYEHAEYCLEELILSNPHNHIYHTTYAEILFTQGGREKLALARKYFAKAAQLNPGALRPLYGLVLTATKTLGTSKTRQSAEDQETDEFTLEDLVSGAKAQIAKAMSRAAPTLRATAQAAWGL